LLQHARAEYVQVLTAAAASWDEAVLARTAASVVALLSVLPFALRRVAVAERVPKGVLALVALALVLHVDLALAEWARRRVLAVVAQPWFSDPEFQPVVEAELGEERDTYDPLGAVTVVLGIGGIRAFPSGAVLPAQE